MGVPREPALIAAVAFVAVERRAVAQLLPAFLLWGAGLGLLTSAMVAAAVGAVESERAGLPPPSTTPPARPAARSASPRSGARGRGGAPRFVHGFHVAALIAAGLYALAVIPAVRRIR
jgi:MFS transporter, DHA2 family, methylenomycin A resistance protein